MTRRNNNNSKGVREECANSLFVQFLSALAEDCYGKNKANLAMAYEKACKSMKAYPIPLSCGKDAMILDGVGKFIADKLDELLAINVNNAPVIERENRDIAEKSATQTVTHTMVNQNRGLSNQSMPSTFQSQRNVNGPKYQEVVSAISNLSIEERKTLFEVLAIMFDNEVEITLKGTVADPQNLIPSTTRQPWCTIDEDGMLTIDMEHISPPPSPKPPKRLSPVRPKRPTMRPLFDSPSPTSPSKRPRTILGELSLNISPTPKDTSAENKQVKKPTKTKQSKTQKTAKAKKSNEKSNSNFEDDLEAMREDVIIPRPIALHEKFLMLIDTREIKGKKTIADRSYLANQFTELGVPCEVRALPLGDILWIAKIYSESFLYPRNLDEDNEPIEVVLDYILERKCIDDYSRSIIDGRYYEQKFRLKRSGVKNVLYLIEGSCVSKAHRLPPDTLESAMVSTQINSQFQIVRTDNIKATVNYISLFTKMLEEFYRNLPLRSEYHWQTMTSFCENVTKTKDLALSDIFAKQLMQIPGCSATKAAAIVAEFPTPRIVVEAFEEAKEDGDTKFSFLSDIVCTSGRRIGPALAKRIHDFYCLENDSDF